MRRKRPPSLRGSVQQNSTIVRVRPRESRFGVVTRLCIASGVVLAILVFGIWSWRSGWIGRQGAALADAGLHLTQKAHFAVRDIQVDGRVHTNEDELKATLEASDGSPIFAFKPAEAEARLAKLPWVESVMVERRLPDTIYVHLKERVPFARWQHDNHLAVIDVNGKVLDEADPQKFDQLPLVVGAGAPAEAKNLLDTLHGFPSVSSKVTAASRVSERRWDLYLQPKTVVKLPEDGVADALTRLSILIDQQKVLDRDVSSIDLRIPDREYIEPGPLQRPANPEGRL